jgi:uncharacterized ion transporter superfamily protein YfcC
VQRVIVFLSLLTWVVAGGVWAESYADYTARHQKMQKMMNPLNVPVANVMNDAWDANPEYANPKECAETPGPKVFYIKSSRDSRGQVTRLPRAK